MYAEKLPEAKISQDKFVSCFFSKSKIRQKVPRKQISTAKDCHEATFQPLYFQQKWTYQRSFYHMLKLLCAALAAHLSHNLFLSMNISVIDPLLEFRFGEILAEMNKPATWRLHFALIETMLCNLCGEAKASFFTLNHHDWLLVMYSFTYLI